MRVKESTFKERIARAKKGIERPHADTLKGKTSDRNRDIVTSILKGDKVSVVAREHGISHSRAREIVHRVCEIYDERKYRSLERVKTTRIMGDDYTNTLPPLLNELRNNFNGAF